MRIIAGIFKGRKIKQPPLKAVRPTKDRVRESVFNIISGEVPHSIVLDLFAGSGAYGLEALSRGAEKAVFIEKNKRCINIIEENILALEIEHNSKLINEDAFKAIETLGEDKEKFDIVFSDPPYGKGMAKKTLIMINHYDILNPTGLLIIEHERAEEVPEAQGTVSILKQKTYKNIVISIFQRK